jgi:two-component system sensor histidine kinase RegB|tara:strand:+ start:8124 stop:9398 length:1275 start_codon:yes stop_codon:yes gene_type:complete
MEQDQSLKTYSLKKSTYVNLRWIAILGQFLTINVVKFILDFEFNFFLANSIVFVGALSNIVLVYFFRRIELSENISMYFLVIDILQLSFLLYLTGGTINPFSIFLLIPSVFAASSLNLKTNLFLFSLTFLSIITLSFFHQELPSPLNNYIFNNYYYYSFPIALIIALIFLNFFAFTFGKESRLRKEALDKLQEVMAKEHELVSLGGQAAAAAHSLGTPLSTIKIISNELFDQLKNDKNLKEDVKLLEDQVNRCNKILKKLTLNPTIEDDFIGNDISLSEYLSQIVRSFEEISKKKFIISKDQDYNSFKIKRSIELIYGIRNFIGNANKFAKEKIYITLKSDNDFSEIIIEDDGSGFDKNVINKIGEPYLKSNQQKKELSGLGLGIFIGKTLLEKNFAKVICGNSETRNGAEIIISWKNESLKKI